MKLLRLAALTAAVLCTTTSCYKVHPTSVAETSIVGEWRASIVRPSLATITFTMIIESDDERQLMVDILGNAGGVTRRATGPGTLNGTAISTTVTGPDFFYPNEAKTFTGTRVSFSRLEGQIVFDVITNRAPMAVTFNKVPLKEQLSRNR